MKIKPADRLFEAQRDQLMAIAYRMLGSVSESEDVVQDAYLRWSGQWRRRKLSDINNVAAFLTSVVTRICLDHLRHRKVEKLDYIGPWLPEPIAFPSSESLRSPDFWGEDNTVLDVEDRVSQLQSINTALLYVLESLSPVQRAVFTLAEVFDYRHQEIAELLGITTVHSRQLLRRAKCEIKKRKVLGAKPAGKENEAIFQEFYDALAAGDNVRIENVLCDDVIAYSDGGGKATAAIIPLVGIDRVSTVFGHIIRRLGSVAEARWQMVNGQLGLVIEEQGIVNSVTTFDVAQEKIVRIYVMRNPDKLGKFNLH